VPGTDDNPRGSSGRAALPRRKPGASYPGPRDRAVGIARVRIPADEPLRRPMPDMPDEPLLRRIHDGLEAMR
jgi:hypothetical protein